MPNERLDDGTRTPFGADRVYGVLGIAMVLAALALWIAGGPGDGEANAPVSTPAPPVLVAERAEPDGVVFRTTEALSPGPDGWAVPPYHLHVSIDGREFMPAATQIERLGAGRFRWVMPSLSSGDHTIRLFWSGPDHQPLQAGASDPLRVRAP